MHVYRRFRDPRFASGTVSGSLFAAVALSFGLAGPTFAQIPARYLLPTAAVGSGVRAITTTIPTGSNNPANGKDGTTAASAFTDDALLSTLNFNVNAAANNPTFRAANNQIITVRTVKVTSGFGNVNADNGGSDTNSDGNDNPFASAGLTAPGQLPSPALRESTDPNVQNGSLTAALNTLSIVQGADGEESGPFSFQIFFTNGLIDGSVGADLIPEFVLFERGLNSSYQLRAIIGGSYDSPTFASNSITVASGNSTQAFASGVYIQNTEIGNGQQLGVTGFDLSDFFLGGPAYTAGTAVFGLEITSLTTSGADLYGTFATVSNASTYDAQTNPLGQLTALPSNFNPTPTPTAAVSAGIGALVGGLHFGLLKLRRNRRRATSTG